MEPSSAFRPSPPFARARQCVLIVEDELLIRTILGDELRDAGFHVIEAFNGDEAVAILFALVRDSFPTLPVIITSGHMRPDLAINDSMTQLVPKPYSMELVVKAARDKLGKAT